MNGTENEIFKNLTFKNRLFLVANNIENTNTTVVYTIPTNRQMNTTCPDLQRQFSNGRPPPYAPAGKYKVFNYLQ